MQYWSVDVAEIENHDFLAMFTVKNKLPYKSDVKGY
jgi:hypothetical protein